MKLFLKIVRPNMKSLAIFALAALYTCVVCVGQAPAIHRLDHFSVTPGGSVTIRLAGNAASAEQSYFDLFPVEHSTDLSSWSFLGMATRTNSSSAAAFFSTTANGSPMRFFRTASNILVTPLPPLTGKYPVGSFSRLMTDSVRTNSTRQTNHQFMVTFFYPAQPGVKSLPAPYWEKAMIPDMFNWYQFAIDTTWRGRDYADAPLSSAEQRWPILLYSPSLNSERRENLFKLLELASHGFVVAAMDHRETFASAFPNGAIVRGAPTDFSSPPAIFNALADRVADAQFVLGQLGRMNWEEPAWSGRLELSQVGAFGFSMGGITSAELCRTDPRIKAGAGMDGIFFIPQLLESPLAKPFLFLRSDTGEITMPDGRPDDRLAVIEKMTSDGYYIQISGTVHWSFADLPLLTSKENFLATVGSGEYAPPIHPLIEPHRINQLSASYLVSFFKKYLRNENDRGLEGSAIEAPEILKIVKR